MIIGKGGKSTQNLIKFVKCIKRSEKYQIKSRRSGNDSECENGTSKTEINYDKLIIIDSDGITK